MPEIKLKQIVSVSSEDKKYPSTNLLGPVGSGKWKSATNGEKQVSLILQFAKPSTINGIHIGNESSAFVEILVGKETSGSDQDWKVALVASSLMTPADSRSNQNTQKVRLFASDSLSKSILSEKWDRAKVICTQPFNRSISYGLSFISFLTEDEDADKKDSMTVSADAEKSKTSSKLGGFILKDDSDSDEHDNRGAMFSDRARIQADLPPPTAAASVRAAARQADAKVAVTNKISSTKSESRHTAKTSKTERSISIDKDTSEEIKPETKAQVKSTKSSSGKHNEPKPTTAKTQSTEKTTANSLKDTLRGVTFAMSGYQNPARADIREKAIEMGAKYRPDWNNSCTHLICAYSNTPKFSQVNGKGYIVSEHWILDSYKKKSKQNWRDYRLKRSKTPPIDKDDKNTKTSDDSKAHKKDNSKSVTPDEDNTTKSVSKASDEDGDGERKPESIKPSKRKAAGKGAVYDDSTDEDEEEEVTTPANKKLREQEPEYEPSSDEEDSDATEIDSVDTDDEIAAYVAKSKSPQKGKQPANGKQAAAKSSADPPAAEVKPQLPDLPDHLIDKTFFLYGNINDRKNVFRYIHAYGGTVEEYMCDDVQYVITDDTWDDNFDSALSDNPNLVFVKSQWVKDIHERNQLLPHQKYAVVPY